MFSSYAVPSPDAAVRSNNRQGCPLDRCEAVTFFLVQYGDGVLPVISM